METDHIIEVYYYGVWQEVSMWKSYEEALKACHNLKIKYAGSDFRIVHEEY